MGACINKKSLITLALCGMAIAGFAQPFIAPQCYTSIQPIDTMVIDGQANETSWKQVPWTTNFVDIDYANQAQPRYRTRAKMLWDSANFYILAELEEPHLWARWLQRDTIIYWDNDFEVFIDVNGDTHHYFEIELNALNTVWDLMLTQPYRDGGQAIFSWDAKGLTTAVALHGTLNNPNDLDTGWTVEMAIPWQSLVETLPKKERALANKQIRINFSRVEWTTEVQGTGYQKKAIPEANWVWSPQRTIAMHEPEFWGLVYLHPGNTQPAELAAIDTTSEKLRQWMYAIHRFQRNLFIKQHRFTQTSKELPQPIDYQLNQGLVWQLWAQPTWYQLQVVHTLDSTQVWHLSHTGKLWIEKLP